MGRFPKYKLTDKQIRGIACIVAHEQGTLEGRFAEASQIANRTDIKGDKYATGANAVKTVTSGWYAHGRSRYNKGTSNKQCIDIVKRVFCDGFRTLPRYINEHDCMSDIATVKNGTKNVKSDKSKWKMHETVIHNRMSSTYTFYSFPGGYKTGVDPFGYTSKDMRKKWGDFCYTVEQAQKKIEPEDEAKKAEAKSATKTETAPTKTATTTTAKEKKEDVAPVDKIISVAKGEVGYLEKKSNKDLASKTGNAGKSNYTKYGKWIGANGDYWCASFLSWLFNEAFGATMGKKLLCGGFSAACETIRSQFKKKKQYHTSNPKKGDVIFFSGTRHSGANHIGLIYKVENGKVYTIEGNTSGASGVIDNGGGVAKKSYKISNSKILGYGRPDYSLVSGANATTKKTETSEVKYYPKYSGKKNSLVDALSAVGVKDTSKSFRAKIALKNGFTTYSGTAKENDKLLSLLKTGKLIKV